MRLHNEVDRLITEFDLNECEAGDLSAFAEVMMQRVELAPLYGDTELTKEVARAHIEMRAEILALVGSEMQGMYDILERASKKNKDHA